jgi:hypothetical protein
MTDQATPVSRDQLAPLLDHGMDALVHNRDQDILIFNPSPEPDSIIEHLNLLFRELHEAGVDPSRIADLLTLTRKVLESNGFERGDGQVVTGGLDALLAQLMAGNQLRAHLDAKGIAFKLRDPLKILAALEDGQRVPARDVIDAGHAVKEVRRLIPDHKLLAADVQNQLGETGFKHLQRLVEGEAV